MRYTYLILIILLVGCKTVQTIRHSGSEITEFKGDTVFSSTFDNLNGFRIYNNDFYNDADVWFSEDAIELTDEGLLLRSYKDTAYHENWRDKRATSWTAGCVDTKEIFKCTNGTWIIEAKTDNSTSAIWLLKDEHFIDGYENHKIIPEVDLMEIINGKFKSTVHWGYMDEGYRRFDDGIYICPWDNEWHEYAVVLRSDGYDFYFDKRLAGTLRSKHKEFTSNAKNYLILNNSCNSTMNNENYNFYIKSITVLK